MSEGDNVVAVFGGYHPVGEFGMQTAETVGRTLGGLGYTVANGGYAGTMQATARGARSAGGHTIGVTCTVWSSPPNEHIREVIPTDSYLQRLTTLIEIGRAGYVALPGATGTLVELALVWEQAAKGMVADRPIVALGNFWQPLLDMMDAARAGIGQHIRLIERPEQLGEVFPQR
jgi:hypothetical protein